MQTFDFIRHTLVEMYKDCTTDIYGQVEMTNLTPSIFGERKDEVKRYCQENKGILLFSTYGGRIGQYTAFQIEDAEIRKCCNDALRGNPEYIRNVNSY